MSGINEGRVVIVTGGGRGIGRQHCLEYARQGAKVVVNDLGGDMHGEGGDLSPAMEVAEEIKAMGGEAVVNGENVADYEGAGRLVQQAVDEFGRLDALVNNAGILRDRMLVNMAEAEWDAVVDVHLKGTFAPTRHAAAYWREQTKAGAAVDARIVNTASPSGLFGNPGQTNYGAAKAGIAAFTIICALELGRYGVNANAIAPVARTRMTEAVGMGAAPEEGFDALDPANISPLVVWLGSPEAKDVTGRVFLVDGTRISVAEGWTRGPTATNEQQEIWDTASLGSIVPDLVAKSAEPATMMS